MAEKKSILALNLGSQRVTLARFSLGSKGSIQLRDYAASTMHGDPTADGTRRPALTAAVKELSSAFKASDSEVNYAVPAQFLISKFVKLPALAEDQVDKIVGFEAQQAVPFPLSETVWDYQLMGKNGGEMEVGIVAVRTEHVNDLNAAVEAASLHPRHVDAAPVALYNAFRYNYPEAEGCSVLIDLGARTTNLIFIEGRRAFISSFQTGGASLSQSIAKEMETDYDTAESRKVSDGFVHLGGNYADHEDPELDAMSKILRTALTKIHGEIVRRVNAYRQQQGGGAPANAYLAGAGASLPYIKEFLEEKLRIPTHYFNALKNVSVGQRVDVEAAGRDAHTLGEVVGLALREVSCPMELDLAPHAVQSRKDVSNRKPYLITAAAALFASLGGIYAYNSSAAGTYRAKQAGLASELKTLEKWDGLIKAQEKRESEEAARAGHLAQAVSDQKYWIGMFDALNKAFSDDRIWITQISPVTDKGEAVANTLFDSNPLGGTSPFHEAGPGANAATPSATKTVTALHVTGLDRAKDAGGEGVVNLFTKITEAGPDSPLGRYFAFPQVEAAKLIEKHLKNSVGDQAGADGYRFHMLLPLKRTVEVSSQAKGPVR